MKTFLKIRYEGREVYLNTNNVVWADYRSETHLLSLLMSSGRYYNLRGTLAEEVLNVLEGFVFHVVSDSPGIPTVAVPAATMEESSAERRA